MKSGADSIVSKAERLGDARRIASQVKRRWTEGQPADARQALSDHPQLALDRSIVLDLAYEEYCRRTAAGESVPISPFCEHFPSHCRGSLERLLHVHQLLGPESYSPVVTGTAGWPEPGDNVLGFRLSEEIGRGAFGRVFLAHELALGNRPVALKVTYDGHAEAEILGRLQHANIVPVHSASLDEATLCEVICMPFLGRATLADVLDRVFAEPVGRRDAATLLRAIDDVNRDDAALAAGSSAGAHLPRRSYVDTVIDWGAQLADALACAHAGGVLHRDIKPTNVLIASDGRPMLLDFNLSRDERTGPRRLGGTVPYMSPEQIEAAILARRPEGAVDARADLYSLAVVLHQTLTGQLPFGLLDAAGSLPAAAEELLRRQQMASGKTLAAARAVDKPLALILEQCLDPQPERRIQSAGELAEQLRGLLAPIRRLSRFAGRHRRLSATSAALLSICLLALAFWIASRPPYLVREYQAGVELAASQDYRGAIECFDRVLTRDRQNFDALLARGNARQRLGMYDLAASDYLAAQELQPSGSLLAAVGYCRSRMRYPLTAVGYYKQALAKGYETLAVQNNLGYAYLQLGERKEARLWLTRAIDQSPSTQAPFANRAFLELQDSLRNQKYLPVQGIEDVERALQIGPDTGDLYCHAARLYALACRRDGTYCDRPLDYLCRAVDHGEILGSFRSAVELAPLLKEPRLLASLKRAEGSPKGARVDRLIPIEP